MTGSYRETNKGIMAGVRARLGYPPYDVIPNDVLYEHLLDEQQNLLTRIHLTSQKWDVVGSLRVTTDLTRDKVVISDKAPNFGRADIVETVDNGAPDFRRREVERVDLQDLNLHWDGHKPIGGDNNYPHIATHVAFYRDSETNQWMAWFVPPAFAPAEYQIWYQPGALVPTALAGKPNFPLETFFNLLKVNTAIALLGLLAKSLQKHKLWDKDVFQALERTLLNRQAEYNEPFDRYILQDGEDDAGYIQPFNGSRRGGDWDGRI